MLDFYHWIISHPLTWVFALGTLTFFAIQTITASKSKPIDVPNLAWVQRNYVTLIIAAASTVLISAGVFYLAEVGLALTGLVDLLREATNEAHSEGLQRAPIGEADPAFDQNDIEAGITSDDLRNLAYAVAVLIGVLAAATTIFFSLVRVWINERQTQATEQGLITDRINKAVEALGKDKEVKRIGEDGEATTVSEPNLEVRIGGILALERISQDSIRDHIQVMEILTAYLRQNAGGAMPTNRPAPSSSQSDWYYWRRRYPAKPPRLDIGAALRVIKRRASKNRVWENQAEPSFAQDLGYTNFAHLDLNGVDFGEAMLLKSNFLGSNLVRANLESANLGSANLQGANLGGAFLKGCYLARADLRGANLGGVDLSGADLTSAKLQGANLSGATLNGANLTFSKMQGAHFRKTDFDAETKLENTRLHGALVTDVDFSNLIAIGAYLEDVFGTGGVILPKGCEVPEHWLNSRGCWNETKRKWRDWIISKGWDDVPLPEVDEGP